jgi:predicted RNase H-like nuclease (RuvC/YqgF family)
MAAELANGRDNSRDTETRVTVLETQVSGISHNLEKIEGKIEANYNTLHHRISELRDDLHEDIEIKHEKVMEKLDEHVKDSDRQNEEIKKMISHIEKWKWMIMGGAIVVGYVLAHLRLEKLF